VTNASDVQEENWKTLGIPLHDPRQKKGFQSDAIGHKIYQRAEQCAKAFAVEIWSGELRGCIYSAERTVGCFGEIFGQNFRSTASLLGRALIG
jgi:hypothetical protein